MATTIPGAITVRDGSIASMNPAGSYQVQAGAANSITYGVPVVTSINTQYVLEGTTGIPVVGTDLMVGISANISSDTASDDGKIQTMNLYPNTVYLCDAFDPTAIATQALYDALVGSLVVFDLTSKVWTVDESNVVSNGGLIIVDNEIAKYPGKVAFKIRQAVNYAN